MTDNMSKHTNIKIEKRSVLGYTMLSLSISSGCSELYLVRIFRTHIDILNSLPIKFSVKRDLNSKTLEYLVLGSIIFKTTLAPCYTNHMYSETVQLQYWISVVKGVRSETCTQIHGAVACHTCTLVWSDVIQYFSLWYKKINEAVVIYCTPFNSREYIYYENTRNCDFNCYV